MDNIYLIGMPGCGKSTLGKKLAEKLNKVFYDTDELVEKSAKMAISEIFEKYGEEHFRVIETDCLIKSSQTDNAVISTGGGIIKKEKNIKIMKNTGRIIYIDTPLDIISSRKGLENRPLLRKNAVLNLEKLYDERHEKYVNAADAVVKISDNIEDNINNLFQAL